MRLARLAALERKKIEDEYLEIIKLIAELEDILANPSRILAVIKDELTALKTKYAGVRRTRIADDSSREMTDEDLIADEDVVITISGRGYIKRQPRGHVPPPGARRQGHHRPRDPRGGRGRAPPRRQHARLGALLHQPRPRLLGQGPRHRRTRSRQAKGIAIINLPGVQVEPGEVPDGHDHPARLRRRASTWSWPPATASSRRRPLEQFEKVRSSGIIAITIAPDDELAWVDVAIGQGRRHRRHRPGQDRPLPRGRGPADGPPGGRRHRHPAGQPDRPRRGHERRPAHRRPARPDRDRLRQARRR